jgi:ribosomal-protein-alanine N-acetyltransferase
MAFTYRFANEKDLPSIVEIENAAMSCPWSLKSYEEAITSDHSFIMVAEDDGRIAAFSVFYLTPPEAELPDIVVDEKYRGQGLGRQLFTKSLEQLETRGIDTIFLEVRVSNTPARRLYESFGFEEISVRKYFYSNPVEDAICMKFERTI